MAMNEIIKNENVVDAYFHGTSNRVTENTHLTEGELVDVVQGNAINVYAFVKGGLYPVEVEPTYLFNVERLEGEEWRIVDACGNDPYEMLEHDILQEGDIIRFVDSDNDEVLCIIPELDLSDMSGVFIVARSLDDVESEMLDKINDIVDEKDDDEEDDDDNYTLDDLSLVPATPIIEYLKRYGQAIQIAANAIDDMDAEYEDK